MIVEYVCLGVIVTLSSASNTGWQGLAACAVKQNDTVTAVAAKPRSVEFDVLFIK